MDEKMFDEIGSEGYKQEQKPESVLEEPSLRKAHEYRAILSEDIKQRIELTLDAYEQAIQEEMSDCFNKEIRIAELSKITAVLKERLEAKEILVEQLERELGDYKK